MKKNLLYMSLCAFSGYFLAVRALGAIFQIFSLSLTLSIAFIPFLLSGIAGFVFADKINTHIHRHAYGTPALVAVSFAFSVLCYISRALVLDFQIAPYTPTFNPISVIFASVGAGIVLSAFMLHVIYALKKLFIKKHAIQFTDVISALIILSILNVLVMLFCKNNRTICYWDNAGFWLIARNLADTFKENGLIAVLKDIYTSVFTQDYNYIIATPMAVLAYIFGESRMVYILGIANLYLFPLYMFSYYIAKQHSKYPIVVSLLTVTAFPFLFFVSTQGYIDAGAIAIACIALGIWYKKRDEIEVEHAIIIGITLALAMVLRRWLVFFAIAYIVAFTVDSIIIRRRISPVIWMLLSLAFGLLFLFQPYVTVKLMANYSSMYASYDLGLEADFFLFVHYIGLIPLLVPLITAVIMLIKKPNRREGLFMLIQLLACFLVFIKIQSHGEQHLMLYIPAIFCLMVFAYSYILKNKKIIFALMTVAVSLIPVYTAITSDNSKVSTHEITLEPCISCMPSKRADVDEILAMTYWLDENVGEEGKRISVLASSLTFNREVLYNAEASLNLRRSSNSDRDVYMPWLPQVDGRDALPYEVLNTEYVLVADPIQTHLAPENQTVVTVPAESFLNGTDIANAFVKLDKSFKVGWDKSINVYIFEKVRDITPEEEQEFLNKFEKAGM